MAQEDMWKKLLQKRLYGTEDLNIGKSVAERDKVPDKACGRCVHFFSVSRSVTGNGDCDALRFGSDIASNPPVYVLEGSMPLPTSYKMDASRCKYYEKREFVDTDATECADQTYSRRMRQMM